MENVSRMNENAVGERSMPHSTFSIVNSTFLTGDGHLSLDETGLTVGYDCGEWFVRSAAKDAVSSAAVSDAGTFRRVYEVRSRHVDPSWNLVKVTRRGVGVANESVVVNPAETGLV